MKNKFDILQNENVVNLFLKNLNSHNTLFYQLIVVKNKYGELKRDRNDIYMHQGKDALYYFNERLTKINGYTLYKMKCNPDFDW
jgi:hypothetical protein